MFRDLKEYQEIAKIYAEKVSKPENLEERRGSSVQQLAQNRKDAFKPATPPQGGYGGGVGNPTNRRGSGAKPRKPEKKMSNIPVIDGPVNNPEYGKNMSRDEKDLNPPKPEIKKTETKPEPKPLTTKQKFDKKFIKKVKGKGFVRRGSPNAQRAEKREAAKLKAQEMAKARIAAKKKKEMSESVDLTPYDLVLEYLLSSEQVATIEEANYVMTEMDAETIQAIVEEQKKNLDEGLGKALMVGGALAAPFLMKKFLKPKTDKMLDKGRKTSPIGGENRKKKIEKAAGAEGFFN